MPLSPDIFRAKYSSWMHTISGFIGVYCARSLFIGTKNPGIQGLFFAVEQVLEAYKSAMTPFGVWTDTVVLCPALVYPMVALVASRSMVSHAEHVNCFIV